MNKRTSSRVHTCHACLQLGSTSNRGSRHADAPPAGVVGHVEGGACCIMSSRALDWSRGDSRRRT